MPFHSKCYNEIANLIEILGYMETFLNILIGNFRVDSVLNLNKNTT